MRILDGRFVPDEEIDSKKHKFIGMFRNPDYKAYQGNGYVMCSCGQTLKTLEQSFTHWSQGHFDVPMYETY